MSKPLLSARGPFFDFVAAGNAAAATPVAQAVTGLFAASGAGLLTVIGDNLDNAAAISRNAAGQLLVNGGAVPVLGGAPTVDNTGVISVFGLGGNDVLALDEANGVLPRALMFGGNGNDSATGGSGADQLFGQAGNDTLNGKGGNDQLFGGSGNDVLVGGDANDQMFGEAGDDRMVWNPGDDDDLMEGGAGTDTAEINGGNGAEVFTATANGARVRFDRVDPAPFAVDIGSTEKLVVNMNGGDDSFSATGNLAALIGVTVDGGSGNDSLLGSNGGDLLIGGDGNDFIDGQQGNDTGLLGAGDDVFQWDPGDGNDTVEGGTGFDAERFNGSAGNEIFELRANGGRTLLTRNLGNIVMDNDDVERFDINALGGTDTVNVRDTGGTDVQEVRIDLAGALGGTAGDGAIDSVVVNAGAGDDFVDVFGFGNTIAVIGAPAFVQISNAEAGDKLVVDGGAGDDRLSASGLPAAAATLTLDGGAGDDELSGGAGADTLIGGAGDDFIDGNQGDDLALMGAGDDIFIWAPGEGNDTLEGGAGRDSMSFLGSGAAERIDVGSNGERVRFFRDVGAVTMDLNDVESTTFFGIGGADDINVGDLSGTDLTRLEVSLLDATSDAATADTVSMAGTQGGDTIRITGANKAADVTGLHTDLRLTGIDAATDRLTINGQGGNDVIDAGGLQAGVIQLAMNGGLGDDRFVGSAGSDVINGGDGDDTARMGAGDDTFVWNPGDDDDTLEGQAGFDTMLFNGANVAENIDISAVGERVRFFRNVANVTMDLDDMESIDFNALGGADNIVVGDLSGTDLAQINLNLGADGAADTVTLQGTDGDDVVQLFQDGTDLVVVGLAATLRIAGFEVANDRIVVNGLAGDDVVEASGLSTFAVTADGGAGDDVLLGGGGNDVLLGGEGDDVLLGGGGTDVLDGGAGDDIEIQSFAANPAALFDGTAAAGVLG